MPLKTRKIPVIKAILNEIPSSHKTLVSAQMTINYGAQVHSGKSTWDIRDPASDFKREKGKEGGRKRERGKG